ncbi:AMP-binding protein [Gordonia sp. KTR9]|uniref:AMP-binding protein n=1 Tax=Gordonia sp. KTR9 TaxID=337191 RepID=UPI00027DE776|nr:AMP-binding protein [Gordonia sp. KTR9]AFR50967.1 Acyl-CoA synthetases (AMP-forming)/AMP-acid ligases II [Gordonia sp. KTR9]
MTPKKTETARRPPSIPSPFAPVQIPDTIIPELLFGNGFGDRSAAVALVDGATGRSITYADLEQSVRRLAGALHSRGIRARDVVAIFAPNSPEWVVAFHGILRANAIVTSTNPLYSAPEFTHQLVDSRATAIFTVAACLDRAVDAAEAAGLGREAVFVLDRADGHISLNELIAAETAPPELTSTPSDLAVLPYSSGTTGLPKGVMLTHRNVVANLVQTAAITPTHSESVILAVLPFFHIYGMTVIMNQALLRRATVVTMPRFDLDEFLRVVAEHRVTWVYIAPPIAVALAKREDLAAHDTSSVEGVVSGAASLDAALGRAVGERLGCAVLQGYGMTELSPTSHMMDPARPEDDLGGIGYALPNIDCRLVDPVSGADVGPGEPGELWVRGPNVMVGYLRNPEATAETLDEDGFLHTGDIATVEPSGLFRIVDRVKELIKYKGYQVPPAELEALLLSHPAVADAAVVGVRDGDGEEIPKAFVVRQPGHPLAGEELIAFVAARVAPHKKVRIVEFIDEIPKSASGKILRKDLRARETSRT